VSQVYSLTIYFKALEYVAEFVDIVTGIETCRKLPEWFTLESEVSNTEFAFHVEAISILCGQY
jgi:hypothetical protein